MSEDGARCSFEGGRTKSPFYHHVDICSTKACMEYAFLLLLMSRKKVFLFTLPLFTKEQLLYDEM